jgi:hypothetical protein
MNTVPTSGSLLDRLKLARRDASDWRWLRGIYLPLIRRWLARVSGSGDEADDLAQDVFVVVVREPLRLERWREGFFARCCGNCLACHAGSPSDSQPVIVNPS